MPSSGPFGTAPDIGIGFSDAALLTFGFAGFGFLAYAVYQIVYRQLKNRRELGDEYGDDAAASEEKKYEERLTEADVATLSRAQRRARARQIMKRQRRAATAPPAAAGDGGDDNPRQRQPAAAALALLAREERAPDEDDDVDDDVDDHPVPSRRERRRLAKATERRERGVLREEREARQARAQRTAQTRRRRRLEEETRRRRETQDARRDAERTRREAWEAFFFLSSSSVTHPPSGDERSLLSVDDWLRRVETDPIVSLTATADELGVTASDVRRRIQTLVDERRVAGVFTTTDPQQQQQQEEDVFVVFSPERLQALAHLVKSNGCVSKRDIADWMNEQMITSTTS